MGKIVKFWLASVLFAITVVIVGMIYFVTVLDPNDYKPDIETMATSQGVDLSIQGDLAWQFFPKPGISISNIEFSTQRQDIHPNLEKLSGQISQATVVTDWRALLDTQAVMNQPLRLLSGITLSDAQTLVTPRHGLPVQLDDINLNVGRISLQDQPFPVSISLTALGGIPAEARFTARIDADNKTWDISKLNLTIDELAIKGAMNTDLASLNTSGNFQANNVNLRRLLENIQQRLPLFTLPKMASQSALTQLSIDGDFDINLNGISTYQNQLSVDGQAFTVDVSTDASTNKLTVGIDADQLNLAMYIPIPNNLASKDSAAIFAPLALPLALWRGQSQMEVSVGEIQLNDFAVTNFYSNIFGNQKVLRVTAFNADMFDGQVNIIAKVDMRSAVPNFTVQPSLTHINLASALPALTDTSELTGNLTLRANIQGTGNSRKAILGSLKGDGEFNIATPSYSKFNIEQTFCGAASLFGSSGQSNQLWPKGTQLDELEGSLRFAQGKLLVGDYTTATGNLSITGNAIVDMLDHKYDLRADTVLTAATTSSNGCSVNSRLQNKTIPFYCKGRFGLDENNSANPAFCKPDERAIKGLLKDTALEKLGEQLFKGSNTEANPLQNLLQDLLQKNLK